MTKKKTVRQLDKNNRPKLVLISRLNKPLISNYFEPYENFSNYFNRNRLGRFRFVFRSSSDQSGIGSMLR